MAAVLSARQPPVEAALHSRCWEGSLPVWRQRLGVSRQGLALRRQQPPMMLSLERLLTQGLLMQQHWWLR